MPPARFFLVNALSALLWAPAYLLPGLVFGASLGLAAEVAGRLALLLALLIAVIWACVWLVQRLFRLLQPHASELLACTLDWSRRHPLLHPLAAALLDPAHPEARGMTILTGLLLAASWGFMVTLQQVLSRSWLANLDPLLFHRLQELRTPWADQVMVVITQLGDGLVLTVLVLGLALWLALRGYWKACLHWLAAVSIATLLTRAIKLSTGMPRPMELYDGAHAFSFPSQHASLSIVVYGFLAILVARELTPARRWIPYVLATLLCVPIAFSRLYLGAHWLSDVLGGLTLGLFWVALMGIAYRTHPGPVVPVQRLSLLAAGLLILASGWNLQQHFSDQLQRYQPQRSLQHWSLEQWQTAGWQQLPPHRQDLRGNQRHPLNLQWVGELEAIGQWLDQQGWETPPGLSLATLLPEFSADPALRSLPVLPQVHDGRHERLRRVRYAEDRNQLLVLRLWPTETRIEPGQRPLWIGNVTRLRREPLLGLFTMLRTEPDFATPFARWQTEVRNWPDMPPWQWRRQEREQQTPLLLLWPTAASVPALSPTD